MPGKHEEGEYGQLTFQRLQPVLEAVVETTTVRFVDLSRRFPAMRAAALAAALNQLERRGLIGRVPYEMADFDLYYATPEGMEALRRGGGRGPI